MTQLQKKKKTKKKNRCYRACSMHYFECQNNNHIKCTLINHHAKNNHIYNLCVLKSTHPDGMHPSSAINLYEEINVCGVVFFFNDILSYFRVLFSK